MQGTIILKRQKKNIQNYNEEKVFPKDVTIQNKRTYSAALKNNRVINLKNFRTKEEMWAGKAHIQRRKH